MSWASRPIMGGLVKLLPGATVVTTQSGPAITQIIVEPNGVISFSKTGGSSPLPAPHNWHRSFSPAEGNAYWVRFTKVSGTDTNYGDTLNTWHALTSARGIGYDVTEGGGQVTGTFTIEISSESDGTPVVAASASGTYSLDVTSTG